MAVMLFRVSWLLCAVASYQNTASYIWFSLLEPDLERRLPVLPWADCLASLSSDSSPSWRAT
ncbi:unnamed protein product [Prunus armeniaca]